MKKEKINGNIDKYPSFFFGNNKSIKKLKRKDFPDVSDEDFEWFKKINETPGEGPSIG